MNTYGNFCAHWLIENSTLLVYTGIAVGQWNWNSLACIPPTSTCSRRSPEDCAEPPAHDGLHHDVQAVSLVWTTASWHRCVFVHLFLRLVPSQYAGHRTAVGGSPEGETAKEMAGSERRMSAEPGGGWRRTRRNDPGRKTHILDATLDVMADHGVTATTHRHIAARAGVPLGSITYHFASLTDLQAQAFARHVELQSTVFENLFADVETREQFVDVLVDLVHGGPARHRSAVLGFELHLAALRNPVL